MPENFDFKSLDLSKEPDQKKFDEEFGKLPEEEQEGIVGATEEEAQKTEQDRQGFIRYLSNGYIDDALEMRDHFNIPEEILSSPKVLEAAKQGFIGRLSNRDVNRALKIKDEFNIPEEILFSPKVLEAVKQILIGFLSNGNVDEALEIKNQFHIPEEMLSSPKVLESAKQGLSNRLLNVYTDDALKIKDGFHIPEEIALESAKQILIGFLSNGSIDDALEIKNTFLPRISCQEIIALSSEIQILLSQLQEFMPHLAQQTERSLDILFALFKYKDNPARLLKNIQEHPFLVNALEQNPRFGSKLLLKFNEFDYISQENIETLFDAKKEILAGRPDIDPESLEFRQLMQEKLKEYKNNPEILEAIKESGVNVDEWLNYSETQYFNLESGNEHLAFSEAVSAPIERIKETIDSYAHTLRLTLKEYRPELSEFKIPLEDSRETEEKIAKMQEELEKAKAEGDEKKAQGIEKGIEGLKKKSENIKTVTLWDKLLGDISAFQQLKNDVFAAQERLMQAEKDLQEKLSDKMPSGKMIQEFKEKINKAKEELRSKFGTLERRIEDFKTNLPELIAPCLGQERSEALIQEIEQKLTEQFDHWNTDRSTLANFFSERGDKEKGKLENQPMSIFVWARNPDIDLYQGNYSPCCICIDSAHMGAESTIADYNTDLGVQIINIYDETKNEPVTAAWC